MQPSRLCHAAKRVDHDVVKPRRLSDCYPPRVLEALERDGVLVRYAWTSGLEQPERLARGLSVLSDDERARAGRFHFERDRNSYVLAHALARTLLSQLTGAEPQGLRFALGEHGRPELDFPALRPRLRFNISHTHGLVACALALEHDVGVDVEHVERRLEIGRVAPSVFSQEERRALAPLEGDALRTRFFQLWTLKEAYIKARGMGLALPLRDITFRLDGRQRPEIALGPALGDMAERWWRPLGTSHMLALALANEPRTVGIGELDPTLPAHTSGTCAP
jgi:4'-phosphopantetheinyl transferase